MALAVAAVIFLVMNVLTTLKGDEYVYALMPGDLRHSCNTLADYVRTMPTFYQTTNGRLADAVERLMASVVGKPIFNILNTMVFVLFVEGITVLLKVAGYIIELLDKVISVLHKYFCPHILIQPGNAGEIPVTSGRITTMFHGCWALDICI